MKNSPEFRALFNSLFNTTFSPAEFSELSDDEFRLLYKMITGNYTGTHHVDDPQFDMLHRPAWRGLVLTLYISVIVIGLVGNVVVVFIVARSKHMQNVTNIFIANLALSDIGLCTFSLPVQLYYQLTNKWIFGEIMCKIIFAAFAVPMYVSTLTILLIACDRYWLIVYPLKQRMRLRSALMLILAANILSIILSVPVIWLTRLSHVRDYQLDIDRSYCKEEWPSLQLRLAYSVCTFLFQFCLPLIITAVLYYKIYCRLKHRPLAQRTNMAINSGGNVAATEQRTGRTNKILFSIVVLFIICWLPWNLYNLIVEIDLTIAGMTIVRGTHFKLVEMLLKMFAMSTACVNPFLYCWLNDNFRKELDSMAIKLRILRQPSFNRTRQPNVRYHAPPTTVGENGHTAVIQDNLLGATTTITVDKTSHYSNVINNTHLQAIT